jgi:hypothetical protein
LSATHAPSSVLSSVALVLSAVSLCPSSPGLKTVNNNSTTPRPLPCPPGSPCVVTFAQSGGDPADFAEACKTFIDLRKHAAGPEASDSGIKKLEQ